MILMYSISHKFDDIGERERKIWKKVNKTTIETEKIRLITEQSSTHRSFRVYFNCRGIWHLDPHDTHTYDGHNGTRDLVTLPTTTRIQPWKGAAAAVARRWIQFVRLSRNAKWRSKCNIRTQTWHSSWVCLVHCLSFSLCLSLSLLLLVVQPDHISLAHNQDIKAWMFAYTHTHRVYISLCTIASHTKQNKKMSLSNE